VRDDKQSGEVTIPIVRHVPTALNEKGISRGWLANPPDPEKLEELGPGIAETLKGLGVAKLRSSSLPRARGTASWLGDRMNIPVESTPDLKTWNTGTDVEGKKESETIPIRKKYIKYPDEKPRGGETFNTAVDRNSPELKSAARYNEKNPDAPMGLVLHGHHMIFSEEVFSGEEPDPDKLDSLDKDFPPGSVMLLHIRGDGAELERIHPKGFDEKVKK
jgi:broad specificity phosphatase PhoE